MAAETKLRRIRSSFWEYRQAINPKLLIGWWQQQVATELQQFYRDFKAGLRPKLLLQSPPQHGKSYQVIDLLSWITGQDPELRVIFSSFSNRLGIRANLRLQRIYDSPRYQALFGTRINAPGMGVGRWQRTSNFLEFIDHDGYFRNTTVGGPITGEGLDISIIDDPIKGRAEASSQVTRDKTWAWLTDDVMPRFADRAAMLMVMTRWHVDDPAGRMIETFPDIKILRYPALAEEDEEKRKAGDPLFPELKSLDFLRNRKASMTNAGWQSVYQQSPIIAGGGIFPIEKFDIIPVMPGKEHVRAAVRYWDKAGTQGGGAFTAGTLMLALRNGNFVIADVTRGQWAAMTRESRIKQTAETDKALGYSYSICVEQEPGSGGKESAEATVRMLAGYTVTADKVSGGDGNKEVRAEPYAAQVQAGNVSLVAGAYVREFLNEHEHFPNGKYKDQVDASAGAFNRLTRGARVGIIAPVVMTSQITHFGDYPANQV